MNKTRYSATEFGGNKPMNFRPSGTLTILPDSFITYSAHFCYPFSLSIKQRQGDIMIELIEYWWVACGTSGVRKLLKMLLIRHLEFEGAVIFAVLIWLYAQFYNSIRSDNLTVTLLTLVGGCRKCTVIYWNLNSCLPSLDFRSKACLNLLQ